MKQQFETTSCSCFISSGKRVSFVQRHQAFLPYINQLWPGTKRVATLQPSMEWNQTAGSHISGSTLSGMSNSHTVFCFQLTLPTIYCPVVTFCLENKNIRHLVFLQILCYMPPNTQRCVKSSKFFYPPIFNLPPLPVSSTHCLLPLVFNLLIT